MEQQPYIILYNGKRTGGGEPGFRDLEKMGPSSAPNIGFEQMSRQEAASAAADPAVEAVTPAMPTALIKPLDAAPAAAAAVAWGLDATKARNSTSTGRQVTVAVLDTGIDKGHAAFDGVAIEERDFSGDGNGDGQGHGTHCAGTIFGRDVGGVRIGVAPGVPRALIGKVLRNNGGGTSAMIFQGLQWAIASGANIVSMSLGFDFPGMVKAQIDDGWPAQLATSNALEAYRGNLRMFDAIMQMNKASVALGSGALIVAASGNESQRNQNPNWRIAASLPAAASDVVSVAAVGQSGAQLAVAPFSNSMATVSAPGVDILSAKAGGGLRSLSGTSMATPHVAGLAALWWEAIAKKGLTPTPKNVLAAMIAGTSRDAFAMPVEIDIGQGLVIAP